ncbi:MAG: hypothetical protein HC806_09410 [Anaerolineae bacterium]|nr:hypothetical protein [Anaerolineae bacterium]
MEPASEFIPPPVQVAPAPAGDGELTPSAAPAPTEPAPPVRWPWLSLAALLLALLAQNSLEPPNRDWQQGVVFYFLGAALLVGAYVRQEWQMVPLPFVRPERDPLTVRQILLFASALLTGAAFFAFGGNRFTTFNLTLWLAALGCLIGGLWVSNSTQTVIDWVTRVRAWRPQLDIRLTPWMLMMIGAVLISAFSVFTGSIACPQR